MSGPATPTAAAADIEQQLQSLIDSSVGDAPGILLAVQAPFTGLDWAGAAGLYDRHSTQVLQPADGFRIASMSKTFTGVLAAQLRESGALDVTQPAADYLDGDIARQIPLQSGYTLKDLTVEHLLTHRGGFNDFATSGEWVQEIAADPGKFRSPPDIAAWALAHGALVGAPGETYHYSDTGYVLLGLLLEQITGTPYWQLCRERIFEPLGMHNTWLEGHEEPGSTLSHPYIVMEGEFIDALQVNGSCDWAGGGHVSTLADITLFLRGLFNCRLFKGVDTLDQFLAGVLAKDNFYYGFGVGRKQIHGLTLWGHLGHWGSFMYYCPEQRLSLAGTLNYDQAAHNEFIAKVLRLLF